MAWIKDVPADFLARLREPWRVLPVLGPVWSVTQIAAELGCSEQSVRSWIKQGRFPRPTFAGFALWYTADEIRSIEGRPIPPPGTHSPTPPSEKRRLTTPARRKPVRPITRKGK